MDKLDWHDKISPEICFIYRVQIQQATIKMTTHSLWTLLTEMDQAIGKTIILMKNSYPQKNIFGLLANIRAFITVVILKNTEI